MKFRAAQNQELVKADFFCFLTVFYCHSLDTENLSLPSYQLQLVCNGTISHHLWWLLREENRKINKGIGKTTIRKRHQNKGESKDSAKKLYYHNTVMLWLPFEKLELFSLKVPLLLFASSCTPGGEIKNNKQNPKNKKPLKCNYSVWNVVIKVFNDCGVPIWKNVGLQEDFRYLNSDPSEVYLLILSFKKVAVQ